MNYSDIVELRWERHRGARLRELAKKYGVTMGHISRIASGEYYPDLGGPITGRKGGQGLTHCIHGHEYTPENTIVKIRTNGLKQRNCRQCKRVVDAARREKKRQLNDTN